MLIVQIAEAARAKLGWATSFPDPVALAVAAGFGVFEADDLRVPWVVDGQRIVVRAGPQREAGLRWFGALASALLARDGGDQGDVEALAGELAVPASVRGADPETLALVQRFAPVESVMTWAAGPRTQK